MAQEPARRIYQVPFPGLQSANRHIYVLVALACLLIVGCTSSPDRYATAKAEAAARIAEKMVGVRYFWGGESPREGFDCSGLVHYSYNKVGVPVQRTTEDQRGQSILVSSPEPGDLLFFDQRGRRASHVGIYIGNGKFVHAPSTGKHVRVDSLSSRYWKNHLGEARRLETTVATLGN